MSNRDVMEKLINDKLNCECKLMWGDKNIVNPKMIFDAFTVIDDDMIGTIKQEFDNVKIEYKGLIIKKLYRVRFDLKKGGEPVNITLYNMDPENSEYPELVKKVDEERRAEKFGEKLPQNKDKEDAVEELLKEVTGIKFEVLTAGKDPRVKTDFYHCFAPVTNEVYDKLSKKFGLEPVKGKIKTFEFETTLSNQTHLTIHNCDESKIHAEMVKVDRDWYEKTKDIKF